MAQLEPGSERVCAFQQDVAALCSRNEEFRKSLSPPKNFNLLNVTLCFYHCVTISHLQSWSVFSWGGWDSGCLRCGGGLKPAETVWTASTFLSANAANRRINPPPNPSSGPATAPQHRLDYVPWQKPGLCIHHCVYETTCVRASQRVLLGGPTGGTSDCRCISFSRERETSECDEARQSASSSKWTAPLQVDPAVHPWPISFIFTTPYSQASCYLFWPVQIGWAFFFFFPLSR